VYDVKLRYMGKDKFIIPMQGLIALFGGVTMNLYIKIVLINIETEKV